MHVNKADASHLGSRASQPRYPWRGFMIDSGRSPNSLPKMKRIVRICSQLGLNFCVFREGDDELCAVRYRTNRLGSEDPYALSMDEVEEFVDYADSLGVKVVPEIESLGHSTAKGRYYPDIVGGGFEHHYEGIGVHIRKSHLAPADPRSYELLESIYEEWFPIIKSPLIHLGLDEVRLPVEQQAEHLEGLLELVDRVAARHNKQVTPIVWADAPKTPEKWRGRVVRCLWAYGDDKMRVGYQNPHLIKQGLQELSEPGCIEPVFMAAGSGSGHTPYSKTDYEHAFLNLAEWAMWGRDKPNFIGLLAVQWSGNMLDDWLPDFACAAEYAWNPPSEIPPFEEQMVRVRERLAQIPDAAHPDPSEVDPPAWDGIWLKDGKFFQDITRCQKNVQ
ncbi:MAG: family 20 glycosylhydrolase [Armatimonadota bacterium]|nr:family 20 glycosylhydrolase [Armatimonadota bacterium]